MIDFIFDMNNVLFTAALMITSAIFGLEALGFLLTGIDFLGMVDAILPDMEFSDPDISDTPVFYQLLGWAKHKQVPVAVWGVMLMGIFGLLGFILQSYMVHHTGHSLNALYAVPACLIPTFFFTSAVSKQLGEHLFVDSTAAVSKESLVGCQGYVTIGYATKEKSAEVSVKDKFRKTHLVMCRAEKGKLIKNDIVEIIQILGTAAVARKVTS